MQRFLVTALLLAAAGCGHFSFHAGMYSEDGVDLPYHRWVALALPEGTAQLELTAGTHDVTLAAGAPALEVQVFSELENDGTVALVNGAPVVSSAGGHGVAIDGVRGTVPATMGLSVTSGTGDVDLSGLNGAPQLRIKCGTGDIRLGDAVLDEVSVESGTGELKLEGSKLAHLQAKCGTGDIRLRSSQVAAGWIKAGTGDVVLSGHSDIGSIAPDFGTGEIRSGD
jgi:Toastrack DUF4097